MPQTSSSPPVTCRPALARDRADIAEFCQGIWDGGDYVPDVWQDWFNDTQGILVSAEYEGKVIGCGKLSLVDEGQWWLEGLRVDPARQGLKVGSLLHNYLTDWWLEHGDGAIRLMTENPAVEHLCGKTGYFRVQTMCGYKASTIDESTDDFSPVTDLREATRFALQSESLQLANGYVDFGWRIGKPNEHVFEKYASPQADYAHTFHWWRDKQGLFSAWEDEDDERRQLFLGVLACAVNDMPALLMDIRRFAVRKKFDRVFLLAFMNPQLLAQLDQAGFSTSWDDYLRLFERKK
jgi:GNAT superfamily N-acetyltransferase